MASDRGSGDRRTVLYPIQSKDSIVVKAECLSYHSVVRQGIGQGVGNGEGIG